MKKNKEILTEKLQTIELFNRGIHIIHGKRNTKKRERGKDRDRNERNKKNTVKR